MVGVQISLYVFSAVLFTYCRFNPHVIFTVLKLFIPSDGRRLTERDLNASVNTVFNKQSTPLPSPTLRLISEDRRQRIRFGKYRGP
jgi:hypothetical protein